MVPQTSHMLNLQSLISPFTHSKANNHGYKENFASRELLSSTTSSHSQPSREISNILDSSSSKPAFQRTHRNPFTTSISTKHLSHSVKQKKISTNEFFRPSIVPDQRPNTTTPNPQKTTPLVTQILTTGLRLALHLAFGTYSPQSQITRIATFNSLFVSELATSGHAPYAEEELVYQDAIRISKDDRELGSWKGFDV